MATSKSKSDGKNTPASKKPLKDLQVRKGDAAKVKGGMVMGSINLR